MSDNEVREEGSVAPSPDETSGYAELDQRLAEPILRGDKGIPAAQVWMSAFLIVIVGAIAYSNCFSIPFHLEDQERISENPAMHHLLTFLTGVDPNAPRPLTTLSFALNWKITPDRAAGFRFVNLALHLACGVLIYLLCRRLLRGQVESEEPDAPRADIPEPVAMLAGMLFVLHPANTESIAYIVGRAGLLGTFFTLSALLLFLRATRRPDDSVHVGVLGLSVLCAFLAWASHEAAIIIPLLILGVDWVVGGKMSALKRLPAQAPYWGLAIILAVVQHVAGGSSTPNASVGVVAANCLHALELTINPTGLSVEHTAPSFTPLTGSGPAVSIVVVTGVLIVGLILLARRWVAGLALVWCVVALVAGCALPSPAASLKERMLYLPLAGAVLMVPWLFTHVLLQPWAKRAVGIAVAIVLAAAGTSTFMRNQTWQSEFDLWADAAQKSPGAWRPQYQLGIFHLARGEQESQQAVLLTQNKDTIRAGEMNRTAAESFRSAETCLSRARDIEPEDPQTLLNLGKALEWNRKPDEALEVLLSALRLDSTNKDCTLRVAGLLQARAHSVGNIEDLRRAMDYYTRAERLFGTLPREVLGRYGMAAAQLGEFEIAESAIKQAVAAEGEASPVSSETSPTAASPMAQQLKGIQNILGQLRQLQTQAQTYLTRNPQDPDGLRLAAEALTLRGQYLRASYLLDSALAQRPQNIPAWSLMGFIRAKMGSAAQFPVEWPAPPTPPDGESPWVLLAQRCVFGGEWDAAQAYLEQAAATSPDVRLPLVVLADIAVNLRQPARAEELLRKATTTYAGDPLPWLRLCDLALGSGEGGYAVGRGCLDEAEKRGAKAEDVASRRDRLKAIAPKVEETGVTTIVR